MWENATIDQSIALAFQNKKRNEKMELELNKRDKGKMTKTRTKQTCERLQTFYIGDNELAMKKSMFSLEFKSAMRLVFDDEEEEEEDDEEFPVALGKEELAQKEKPVMVQVVLAETTPSLEFANSQ